VARRDGHLILRVENDCAEGSQPVDFTPRSISERASTLGGSARVEQTPAGATAVVISIPL
jgi:signal transduction histidine kinase